MVSEPTGREFESQEERLGAKKKIKKMSVAKSAPAVFHLRGSIKEWAPPKGEY